MDTAFDEIFDGMSETRRPRPEKKPRRARRLFAVLGVLVLLIVVGLGGFVWFLGHQFDDRANHLADDQVFGGPRPDPGDGALNILLLGADEPMDMVDFTDSRGLRSDTIMVAHIPADRRSMQLMSIPRDSWVSIDGHGEAKINAALSFGGLPLAVKTIGEFIDAPIHHVAVIDFEGFKLLTDSLGGVDVESPEAFTGKENHTFVKGMNHLDGDAALAFVRERYAFKDGDLQRGRNQQEYLGALFEKISSAGTLSNPARISSMVTDFAPYMYLDEKLTASAIGGIGFSMRDVRSDDIVYFTAPINGSGKSSSGQLYLRVDEKELQKVREAFAKDTVKEYAETAKEQTL